MTRQKPVCIRTDNVVFAS